MREHMSMTAGVTAVSFKWFLQQQKFPTEKNTV